MRLRGAARKIATWPGRKARRMQRSMLNWTPRPTISRLRSEPCLTALAAPAPAIPRTEALRLAPVPVVRIRSDRTAR